MEPLFASVLERGFSLSEVHRENHVPQLKGVWVSLAYTRGFGSLGPKFKSWYAHHFSLISLGVNPDYVVAKLSFDEPAWDFIYFRLPNT